MTERRKASREQGITLRGVSRTVTGPQRKGNRVTYEWRGHRAVPERIVVLRCRHDKAYRAFRLPPSIWRTLGLIEEAERQRPHASPRDVVKQIDVGKSKRPGVHLVEALRGVVSPERLRALIRRHTSGEADSSRPGVPDLIVFKERSDSRPYAARFVEVKRPDEQLGPHQREEIRFMRSLGLKAGVLRLVERPARGATAREGQKNKKGSE